MEEGGVAPVDAGGERGSVVALRWWEGCGGMAPRRRREAWLGRFIHVRANGTLLRGEVDRRVGRCGGRGGGRGGQPASEVSTPVERREG